MRNLSPGRSPCPKKHIYRTTIKLCSRSIAPHVIRSTWDAGRICKTTPSDQSFLRGAENMNWDSEGHAIRTPSTSPPPSSARPEKERRRKSKRHRGRSERPHSKDHHRHSKGRHHQSRDPRRRSGSHRRSKSHRDRKSRSPSLNPDVPVGALWRVGAPRPPIRKSPSPRRQPPPVKASRPPVEYLRRKKPRSPFREVMRRSPSKKAPRESDSGEDAYF